MKKTIIISSLVFITALSFSFAPEPPRFENLKVLPKSTDKHQMDSIMRHFCLSLGVKCNHCHAVKEVDGKRNIDFASDENKNKDMARQMFKMMNKINSKYFKEDDEQKGVVNGMPMISCYSCHHGQEKPENKPPTPQRQ